MDSSVPLGSKGRHFMLKFASSILVVALALEPTAMAQSQFKLLVGRMPSLQVGATTLLSAADYTSVDNETGILVSVTGGYASLPNYGAAVGPAWSYEVQLFKDGDEFPVAGAIDTARVSGRTKCGCIELTNTGRKISNSGEAAVLVTDQDGFNTTIYEISSDNAEKPPAVYVRLDGIDIRQGGRGAEISFYSVRSNPYAKATHLGDRVTQDASSSSIKMFLKEGQKITFPFVGKYKLESLIPAQKTHGAWAVLLPVN